MIQLATKASQEEADAAVEALKKQFKENQFNISPVGEPTRFRIGLEGAVGIKRTDAPDGENQDEKTKAVDTPTIEAMRRVAQTTLNPERLKAAQRRGSVRTGSMSRGGQGGTAAVGAGTGKATTGGGGGASTGGTGGASK
jgi:hypothetical protein